MIVHIWSKFSPRHPEAQRRHALAQSTWKQQPWEDRGIDDASLKRLFVETSHGYPYVRDIMDAGCLGLVSSDIAVFTNADIGMVPDACFRISCALQDNDAGYAFRNDFHHRLNAVPTVEQVAASHNYAGKDVYFFRVAWWLAYRHQFPDMVIGREAWDAVMVELVEATNPNKPLSLPNLCWHERHGGDGNGSYWEDPVNRYTLPGQRYNLKLAKDWMLRRKINPAKHGIR